MREMGKDRGLIHKKGEGVGRFVKWFLVPI